MTTQTETRQVGGYVGAHAADRKNGGLILGILAVLVVAAVVGVLVAWALSEHAAAQDARVHAQEAVDQRDAIEDALAVAEEQADDAQAQVVTTDARLAACADVVSVSVQQRAAVRVARKGWDGALDRHLRKVNRILNGGGYRDYTALWNRCSPERRK